MSTLIPSELMTELLTNGARRLEQDNFDPYPVVKLFTPDAGATWLITEADPEDPDILFGLCDLGLGFPELGSVNLSEIASIRGRLSLPPERDLNFQGKYPLSWYAARALSEGRIITE